MKRQPLSLADKVRARIELHDERATSSQVLPYVGATAAEVKELPGIVVTVERSGKTGGRPPFSRSAVTHPETLSPQNRLRSRCRPDHSVTRSGPLSSSSTHTDRHRNR